MTNAPDPAAERPAFLNGGGELADLIAGFNWAETPLGPLAGWDATLRATLQVYSGARLERLTRLNGSFDGAADGSVDGSVDSSASLASSAVTPLEVAP